MKKIRILFCFHNTDRYSGATKSLIDIISSLERQKDIEIVVSFPYENGTAVDYFKNKGTRVIFLYYRELAYQMSQKMVLKLLLFPRRLLRYFRMQQEIKRQRNYIKSLGIDVVYTNTSTIFVGAFIKKQCGIPHIWHLREFREEDHGTRFFFGNTPFYYYLNNYTDKIIVLSKAMKDKLDMHVLENNKICVIYNDIGKENINPRVGWNEHEDVKCLIAGTLESGKGQLEAIKGVEYANNMGAKIKLDIAGKTEGSYYQLLNSYCKENSLENSVRFLGFIKDLKSIRHHYEIAIMASHNEAFGRVTVEAMLSQLAVVGADAGGTSELINDGVNGRLYSVGDYVELGNILYELYFDREKIHKLAENGYNLALEYTKGNCAMNIYNIVIELIG